MDKGWNLPGNPPHIAAHYMPWFQVPQDTESTEKPWSHWSWNGTPSHHPSRRTEEGIRDLATAQYPLIGPYDSSEEAVIRYHLATAKAAGIEVIIPIWYGPGSSTDDNILPLLEEAERQGLKVGICYEEKINFPPYRDPQNRADIVQTMSEDLNYILATYGQHPAYLRKNGVPFVCQFNYWGTGPLGPNYLTPMEWKQVQAQLEGAVVFARQNLDAAYHPAVQGAFHWWTADPGQMTAFIEQAQRLKDAKQLDFYMTMAAPGFNDKGVQGWGNGTRFEDRQDGKVWQQSLQAAAAGNPDLIQIVTWNDFNEGTEIEPTLEHGFNYLDALEQWIGKIKGRPVNLDDNRRPYQAYQQEAPPRLRELIPESKLRQVPES